jgi:hypothetical protein
VTYTDQILDRDGLTLFEGTPEEVRKWLEERPLYRADIKVYVGRFHKIMGAEEYLNGPEKTPKVAKQWSEEDLRRMFREELKLVFESMAKTASNADGYETGELESAGLKAIANVAERMEEKLPHSWDCAKRERFGYSNKCTCSVGDSG